MSKKSWIRVILSLAILIVLLIAIYFSFFFYYKCSDIACFQSHQQKCTKTKFINDGEYSKWLYEIRGKDDGNCVIDATILELKQGTIDKKILEGKTMTCFLPIGNIASPEDDLARCHGILKEEIQGIMIKNAHAQIIANIGQISEELGKIY